MKTEAGRGVCCSARQKIMRRHFEAWHFVLIFALAMPVPAVGQMGQVTFDLSNSAHKAYFITDPPPGWLALTPAQLIAIGSELSAPIRAALATSDDSRYQFDPAVQNPAVIVIEFTTGLVGSAARALTILAEGYTTNGSSWLVAHLWEYAIQGWDGTQMVYSTGGPETQQTFTVPDSTNYLSGGIAYVLLWFQDSDTLKRFSNYTDYIALISTAPDSHDLSGTIGGYVGENDCLDGVTIALSGAGSGTTTTDSNGNYSFTDRNAGEYTVTASKTGCVYDPIAKSVPLYQDQAGVNFESEAWDEDQVADADWDETVVSGVCTDWNKDVVSGVCTDWKDTT